MNRFNSAENTPSVDNGQERLPSVEGGLSLGLDPEGIKASFIDQFKTLSKMLSKNSNVSKERKQYIKSVKGRLNVQRLSSSPLKALSLMSELSDVSATMNMSGGEGLDDESARSITNGILRSLYDLDDHHTIGNGGLSHLSKDLVIRAEDSDDEIVYNAYRKLSSMLRAVDNLLAKLFIEGDAMHYPLKAFVVVFGGMRRQSGTTKDGVGPVESLIFSLLNDPASGIQTLAPQVGEAINKIKKFV